MNLIKSFQNRKQQINDFKADLRTIKYIKDDTYFNDTSKIPDDKIVSCKKCNNFLITDQLVENGFVCTRCGHHHKLDAYTRIDLTFDSFEEHDKTLKENSIVFEDYKNKIESYREKTSLIDAVVTGVATIEDTNIAVGVMDSYFMMGSMGQIVGEKITRLVEYATENNLPLILFCTSGGARMQEGIISLMQMAKVSQAINIFREKGLYISVLTNPTTGGVSASFASLGDITIAEPNALIGFAGRRVIENTINQKLPQEFQTSEFLLKRGFLDMIVERKKMKDTLYSILKLHNY